MVNGIQSISPNLVANKVAENQIKENSISFERVLTDALKNVESDIKNAQDLSNQLVAGEVNDLHQVMIQMEKANLGLQLTVQVRNKVVEAYQEIMRMQV